MSGGVCLGEEEGGGAKGAAEEGCAERVGGEGVEEEAGCHREVVSWDVESRRLSWRLLRLSCKLECAMEHGR